MDQVDTLHVGRYWSEVLCCTIMTHPGDIEVKVEVKVTDLDILIDLVAKHKSGELRCPATALIICALIIVPSWANQLLAHLSMNQSITLHILREHVKHLHE